MYTTHRNYSIQWWIRLNRADPTIYRSQSVNQAIHTRTISHSTTPSIKSPVTINKSDYKQYNYHRLANYIIIGSTLLSGTLWLINDLYTFDTHNSNDAEHYTLEYTNKKAYDELYKLLHDRISIDSTDILQYGKPQYSYHTQSYPSAICTVESTNEISTLVKICNKYDIAIIAYGSGTSLEGHTSSESIDSNRDSIVLNIQNMSDIIRVSEVDLSCVVQPGISWNVLNDELKKYGLWYPVDPVCILLYTMD